MFWIRNESGLRIAFVAAALIVGEVAGFMSPQISCLWPWCAFLSVLAFLAAWGWSVPCLGRLALLAAGVASAWRVEADRLSIEQTARRLDADGRPPSFELKVESEVVRRRRACGEGWVVSFRSHVGPLPVKVIALEEGLADEPTFGETWRCAGWLTLKKDARSRYDVRTLWVVGEDGMERVSSSQGSGTALYRKVSSRLASCIGTGLGWCPDIASLNSAMLLGRRAAVPAARRRMFATAGTLHVFAISGLHVMLIASIVNVLLSCFGFSAMVRAAVSMPLIAAYVMLSGGRPSAVRAAIMVSLWLFATILNRRPDALSAWGLAAFVVCGLSPELLFDVGCVMSFAVMLGIVLWIRWSVWFAEPRQRFLRMVSGGLGISAAAWIAGAPVCACVFGRITFGSLVANVAVVPLAGMSVTFGVVGASAAALSLHAVGVLFNNLSALCTWTMEKISELVACCPGVSFATLPWSAFDCCLWYIAWFALFALLSRHLPPRDEFGSHLWIAGGGRA